MVPFTDSTALAVLFSPQAGAAAPVKDVKVRPLEKW